MENMKKHPSLPSNYVTIADLKQRWLKQQQQQQPEQKERQREKEEAEETERQRFQDLHQQQREEEEKQHQRGEPVAVVRTRSAPGTRNVKRMQYRSKFRTDSGTNSRWIAVTGDGNAELDNKGKQLKKMMKKKNRKSVKKRNPKVEEKEKETCEESESEISEAKKSTIESELNEVEKNAKQNPDVEEKKKKENEAIEESENSEAKKSTSETELNGEKKDDSIVEETEEKFGGLSVNAGNGKQVWRTKRLNEGFGHSQPVRKNEYYFGGHRHGFSRRYGGFGRHNDKGKKVVWVRKGGNDNGGGGEIEA